MEYYTTMLRYFASDPLNTWITELFRHSGEETRRLFHRIESTTYVVWMRRVNRSGGSVGSSSIGRIGYEAYRQLLSLKISSGCWAGCLT